MTEESNIFIPINEKEILSENINKISIPNNIKQNLILPNLNSNYVTLSTNNVNEKKIAFNPMKKYEQKNIDKTKHLNKSSSYFKSISFSKSNNLFCPIILLTNSILFQNSSLFGVKLISPSNKYKPLRHKIIILSEIIFTSSKFGFAII